MTGALDNSPAEVVAYLLVARGQCTLGGTGGIWPIFIGYTPDSPDDVIVITDTTGAMDGQTQVDGEQCEHHGLQIKVRSKDNPTGYVKIRALAVYVDENILRAGVTVGSNTYTVQAINRQGGVLHLGREAGSERDLFSINALVTLRQTS